MFLLFLIGTDFILSRLAGNSEEGRKRHALALEKLQRARAEWNKQKVEEAKYKR